MTDTEFQTVIITLDNGKRGLFTGKVLVRKEDETITRIENIEFCPPETMPADCSWGIVKDLETR